MQTKKKIGLNLPLEIKTKVRRFSPLREGGPGLPSTLLIHALLSLGLYLWAYSMLQNQGMSSAGPALMFLSIFWIATLIFWIIIKAFLRDLNVKIILDAQQVQLILSERQNRNDRILKMISIAVFLMTLKGGQWSGWQSLVKWKKVKRIKVFEAAKEILIIGGPWRIRIPCNANNFEEIHEFILSKVPTRAIKK